MPSRQAQRLVGDYDTVIIDTPGFRSQGDAGCLGVTDFVLVPVKPSPFDVDRMLDTLNILINGVSGRRPDVPLRPHPDHARLRHRQAHPLRARGSGLPGARQRDDKPRRLCRGRALGRNAEHDGQERAGCPRNRGDRRRGQANLRQHGSRSNGRQAHEQEEISQGRPADGGSRCARPARAPQPMSAATDNVIEMVPKSGPAAAASQPAPRPPIPQQRFGEGRRSRSSSAMPTIRRSAAPFRCRLPTPRRSRRSWCGWSNR